MDFNNIFCESSSKISFDHNFIYDDEAKEVVGEYTILDTWQ